MTVAAVGWPVAPPGRRRSRVTRLLVTFGALSAGAVVLVAAQRAARASAPLTSDPLALPSSPDLLEREPGEVPSGSDWGPLPLGAPSADDIEAAARMIASENPSASDAVKVEQIWTQIRSTKPGKTLHQRITAGKGYGPQGGSRPVSTAREAKPADRELAARVLRGELQSQLPGARKYFEPDAQDRIYRQVQRARAELAAGRAISANDQRLIDAGYKRDAQMVRDKWSKEGGRFVGSVSPVEFWT